jgi:LEA14-like dessication related protein
LKLKLNKVKIILVILVIVIVSIICYYIFNPRKAINLIFPGINEISFIHIDLKKDSALLKLYVFIQNKMPYKMVIDTLNFEIKLNGFKMVEEAVPLQINQKWFETDTIELPVHISLKEIKKTIGDLHGQDSTDMEINFDIVYNTLIGREKISINRKIRIEAPIPPKVTILKLEHKKYNLKDKTIDAVLKLEIINKGKNIDVQLNEISYNLQIINTLISKGTVNQPIDINPLSSQIIDIPIIIEYSSPFKTAWQIITNNDILKYDLNLKCKVKANIIKDSKAIPVEIDATGTMELVKN